MMNDKLIAELVNKDKIIDDLKASMRDAMFQINCEDPWQAYEILEEAVQKTTAIGKN
jgi:hypothetical protein